MLINVICLFVFLDLPGWINENSSLMKLPYLLATKTMAGKKWRPSHIEIASSFITLVDVSIKFVERTSQILFVNEDDLLTKQEFQIFERKDDIFVNLFFFVAKN